MSNVTVFSSSSCAVCHAEMQWLDKQGVKYDNVVIDEDDQGLEKMMEASGGIVQGTPFTLIETEKGKETVTGFDRPKLQQILGLS